MQNVIVLGHNYLEVNDRFGLNSVGGWDTEGYNGIYFRMDIHKNKMGLLTCSR